MLLLGIFRIRIAVMGSIQTTNKEYYKINIKKVAFYIIDSFDFIDNTFFSQPLGLWDIVNKKNSFRYEYQKCSLHNK